MFPGTTGNKTRTGNTHLDLSRFRTVTAPPPEAAPPPAPEPLPDRLTEARPDPAITTPIQPNGKCKRCGARVTFWATEEILVPDHQRPGRWKSRQLEKHERWYVSDSDGGRHICASQESEDQHATEGGE